MGIDLGMTDERLSAVVASLDEIEEFRAKTQKDYYVLAEQAPGRITLKDLRQQITMDELRRPKPDYHDDRSLYVEAEGEFFPDLIEENGIYLVSMSLYEMLNNTLRLRQIKYHHIGIVGEKGARIEDYCLIAPQQIDAIIPGSARYDQEQRLVYFELDESKVGQHEIFRLKGFPHLMVTQKINRISGAGYQCTRLENFCDYEGERDRLYQERQSGQRLERIVQEYEKQVRALDKPTYRFGLQHALEPKQVQKELAAVLKPVFDSYTGEGFHVERLAERRLTFFWPWGQSQLKLSENADFSVDSMVIPALAKAFKYIETLPEQLQSTARQICFETLLSCLVQECQIFEGYTAIHSGQRFRLYLDSDFYPTTNPPMIYDYKSPFQREVEAAVSYDKIDLNRKDLREFNFSGKNLSIFKLTGSDLSRANFKGAVLERTEFVECDLTGAVFGGCNLKEAKFTKSELNRTNFDNAIMPNAVIAGSELYHCSFFKTDLTGAQIKNRKMFRACFNKAKLANATITIRTTIMESIFRQCDLRNVKISGDYQRSFNIMAGCDFRNSDLTEAQIALQRISKNNFSKTKLIAVDWTRCSTLQECNFQWSSCAGMNLEGLTVEKCNFEKVDLSYLKPKSGAWFEANNFSQANFSGYDFAVSGYSVVNNLTCANLTGCNLEDADLSTSNLFKAVVDGAKMLGAILDESQLQWVKLSGKQREEIELLDEDAEDEEDDEDEDDDYADEKDETADADRSDADDEAAATLDDANDEFEVDGDVME